MVEHLAVNEIPHFNHRDKTKVCSKGIIVAKAFDLLTCVNDKGYHNGLCETSVEALDRY